MNERILIKVRMIGRTLEAAKMVDAKFLERKAAELSILANQVE